MDNQDDTNDTNCWAKVHHILRRGCFHLTWKLGFMLMGHEAFNKNRLSPKITVVAIKGPLKKIRLYHLYSQIQLIVDWKNIERNPQTIPAVLEWGNPSEECNHVAIRLTNHDIAQADKLLYHWTHRNICSHARRKTNNEGRFMFHKNMYIYSRYTYTINVSIM